MYVLSNQAPSPSGLPGVDHVTLAGSDNGLRNLSVWQQSLAAGAATPPHRHDCEEVVLCTAGSGELHVAGRVMSFHANSTVIIPADAEHQIINAADKPLELIAVFSCTPVLARFPNGDPIPLPWHS